ncbi:MAG: hypothetical protein J5787_03905 [Alphaproteobacteria bacterium]|nr:hypothetical protein [Alphaproteobacteria bacterium]
MADLKRSEQIKIEFYDVCAGWLHMRLCVDDEIVEMRTTYCLGDGFRALLRAAYYLHPDAFDGPFGNSGDFAEQKEIEVFEDGEKTTVEVPYKVEFDWNEEGSWVDWTLEHEPTLDREFDLKIELEIHRADVDRDEVRVQKKEFVVSYKAFCYALAKACTEMLKKQGICGFRESYWDGDINLRYLLFIKAIALDCPEMIKTKYNDRDELCSNLEKEIKLLLTDM